MNKTNYQHKIHIPHTKSMTKGRREIIFVFPILFLRVGRPSDVQKRDFSNFNALDVIRHNTSPLVTRVGVAELYRTVPRLHLEIYTSN